MVVNKASLDDNAVAMEMDSPERVQSPNEIHQVFNTKIFSSVCDHVLFTIVYSLYILSSQRDQYDLTSRSNFLVPHRQGIKTATYYAN